MPTATSTKGAAGLDGPSTASTSALASASITTSEQLVKALRVPQPPANGVRKIDIALEAWQSSSIFVPKKAELLSQWVLEHLCSSLRASSSASVQGTPNKGKTKCKQQQVALTSASTVLHLKSWELLAAIEAAQTGTLSELSETAKRSWLSHLANTQPVLALAADLAKQVDEAQSLSLSKREALLISASASLAKLLPPATSRNAATNIEAAADAIQAWLEFFARSRSATEQRTGHTILQSIVATWTTTLQYGSNAKRNHQHFCSNAVPSLLRALHTLSPSDAAADPAAGLLLQTIKQIAAESLFTEDVQRLLLQAGRSADLVGAARSKDTKTEASGIVAQLTTLLQDPQLSEAALSSLPALSSILYAKLARSEVLNSIASSSNTSSGSVRETQLSLVRKTMLSEWVSPLLSALCNPLQVTGFTQYRAQQATARRGLLEGIERDSLYVMGCEEHEAWRSFFSTLFNSTKDDLRQLATDTTLTVQAEKADHFACLASLWRLEMSVMEDELAPIFALVAVQHVSKPALWLTEDLSVSTRAALDFFRAVAAIDVRFRTVPSLINDVLTSIPIAVELLAKHSEATELSTSLFTSQTFLAELGKLCRERVTPMQVPDLIHRLSGMAQALDSILTEPLTANPTQKAAKRQRTASSSPAKSNTAAFAPRDGAYTLIAQLRIAAQVVQSVHLASTFRARSISAAEELHNNLILPCLDPCLASTHELLSPSLYGVAAAALRVRQALLSEKWRYDASEPVKLDGSLPTESLACLESSFDERVDSLIELLPMKPVAGDAELCQLQFQIVQSLLQRAERDTFLAATSSRYCQLVASDAGPVFDLLTELSKANITSTTGWSGCPNRIQNRGELLQVVWMAILTRWAPLLESLAAQKTLGLLADIIVATAEPSSDSEGVGSALRCITSTTLRNASFLELPKWRKHIVACIQEQLSSSRSLERRLSATAPLWIAPSEWVNRPARGPLLAKLLALDRDIVSATQQDEVSGQVAITNWTELRSLLARVQEMYATESDVSDASLLTSLQALLLSDGGSMAESDARHAWARASLALVRSTVRVLLTRSKQNPSTKARLVEAVKQLRHDTATEKSRKKGHITLKMRAAQDIFAILGDIAAGEVAADDAPGAVKDNLEAIKELPSAQLNTAGQVARVLDTSLYHLREIRLLVNEAGADGSNDTILPELLLVLTKTVVSALCVIFHRAALLIEADSGENHPRTNFIRPAAETALELMRCIHACGSSISTTDSDGASALAACLAYSALIASFVELQEQRLVADGLQRIISQLEAEHYDHVLTQLLSALRSTSSASGAEADGDAAALVSTIGLVLGSAPQGTSKIARAHLSHWLAILTGFSGEGEIRLRTMVASVSALDLLCGTHAMLFRTQDTGAVLQLFSTITGPSMSDEPSPSLLLLKQTQRDAIRSKLFDGIVSMLSSLMRLRQDLVLSFLPQLGTLLARMCTLFRRLRRSTTATSSSTIEASGLQKRQLRRDLPSWLDPVLVTPLTAEREARTLSRLLSTLIVKNVSLKTRASSSEVTAGAKAESLARPFSKHATYILVAYLKSLTAPNSMVPADVRAELEVGMLVICEIIGHHQRDAAMVGLLDSAGKILMKRLWTEYEKQRYKGQ